MWMVLKKELGLMRKEAVVVRFQETSRTLKYENPGYPAWPIIRPGVSGLRSESAKTWRNRKRIYEVLKERNDSPSVEPQEVMCPPEIPSHGPVYYY
jgi:hypothetical protein